MIVSADRRPMFSKISLHAQRREPTYTPAGAPARPGSLFPRCSLFCDAGNLRATGQTASIDPAEKATFGRKTKACRGALREGMGFMEAGYLGVGAMGQPMASKLLDAGHSLTIYDISEAAMRPLLERQARRASSPRDLADRCEIVFVSLPTLAAFREVAFGADGLAHGTDPLWRPPLASPVGRPFAWPAEPENSNADA
jgi:NAD binding domain of 6-phosphogluconate dehydrogenase